MIKNVTIFILAGLLIVATFGVYLRTALDHPILGVTLGTQDVIFLG